MLNFGWAELLVIGLVALIVIGPEDLPDMFRQLGRFTAKLRSMSREFSRAMEQAAKDSGVKDVTRDLKNVTSAKSLGLDAVKSAADKFEKWDPIKNAAKPSMPLTSSSSTGSTLTQSKPLVPAPIPPSPAPKPAVEEVLDDSAEAEDDLLDDVLSEEATPPHGPATQALYDKQALRAQVLAEQTAKLKAIEDGTYQAEPTILPPAAEPAKPAPKARAAKTAEVPAATKPRATRTKKAEPAPEPATKPVRAPRKTTKKADQA